MSPARLFFNCGFSPPSPFGLWRLVWFFSFSLFLAGKHYIKVPEGESLLLVSLAEGLGSALVFLIFEARFALFRHPLVDTRPPALLAAVLWFSRRLLRPKSSSVIGTWFSLVRVFFTHSATHDGHATSLLLCLVAPEGFWRLAAVGDLLMACVCHTCHLQWCFLSTATYILGVFLVFDRLYLTILLYVRFSLIIAF